MKIAICDDDYHMREVLRTFIDETYRDLDMLADGFTSGQALLAAIRKQTRPYDLILLDIEMFGMDGIETARQVRSLLPDCYIVFITSHEEYALTGYEVAAFRYLLKPLQPQKLAEAISAVRAELADQQRLHVEHQGEEAALRVRDILYIEAQDKHVRLVMKDGVYIDRRAIKAVAAEVAGADFFLVHRSVLVNLRFVVALDADGVRMADGATLPVSRLRRRAFQQAFRAYVTRTAR